MHNDYWDNDYELYGLLPLLGQSRVCNNKKNSDNGNGNGWQLRKSLTEHYAPYLLHGWCSFRWGGIASTAQQNYYSIEVPTPAPRRRRKLYNELPYYYLLLPPTAAAAADGRPPLVWSRKHTLSGRILRIKATIAGIVHISAINWNEWTDGHSIWRRRRKREYE